MGLRFSKHTSVKHRRYSHPACLEGLESRHLLTADLTGAFTSFPAGLSFSGTKPSVSITVTNHGTTPASGSLLIDTYAAIDGMPFDPLTAVSLGRFTTNASMGPGGTQAVTFALNLSPMLAAEDYRIYAVINPTNKIVESDTTNNIVTSNVLTIAQPNYDLSDTFGAVTIPSTAIAGTTKGSASVIVRNTAGSTVTIPSGVSVGVEVVARPVGAIDDTQDVVLNKTAVNVGLGPLAPGKSHTAAVALVFPSGITPGVYTIVAKADSGNVLAETHESNNEVVLASTVTVVSPSADLGLTLNAATKLPSTAVISDGVKKIPITLNITNLGNITTTNGLSGVITVVAHRASDNAAFTLGTFNVNAGGLASAKVRSVTLSPLLSLGLESGTYSLVATLTTEIETDSAGNNTASTAATLIVNRGFIDLAATITSDNLPPAIVAGMPKKGTVNVKVQNLGNVTVPAGRHVNVTVALRPTGGGDDVPLGALLNQSISGLTGNSAGNRLFAVPVSMTELLAEGDYVIVATVTPVEALVGDETPNNAASGAAFKVAPRFIDLGITTLADTFPPSAVSGASGYMTLQVENLGNYTATTSVGVLMYASTTGDIADGVLIGGGTISVNLAPGAMTGPQKIRVALPATFASTTYTLFAKILPTGVNDTNEANNVASVAEVTAAPAFVDWHLKTAANPFSGAEPGGTVRQAGVVVENLGNISNSAQVTVTYYASTSGAIDGSAVVIGTRTLSLSLGAGAASSQIFVNLTLPVPVANTTYSILAKVSATGLADGHPENNVTAPLGDVLVNHFTSVFPATLGDTLTFTASSTSTVVGITTQKGTFVTDMGIHGTYTMSLVNGAPIANTLSLKFNGVALPYTMSPQFDAVNFPFGGHTIACAYDPAGSVGHMLLGGKMVYFS